MPPSVVQAAKTATTGTSVTVTLGSPTTAGNALVAMVISAGSTNGSVSAVTLGGSADHWAAEATKGITSDHAIATCWSDPSCAAGQTSVVITISGGTGTQTVLAWVYEVSGMAATGPLLDQQAGVSSSGFVSSWTLGPTGTTGQASEVWFGVAGGNVSGTSVGTYTGPSSPWVNQPQQGVPGSSFSLGGVSGSQVVAATGTASYSGSVTPASTIEGLVVTLKAAAGVAHTATASLTVSPSLSAARTRGKFRTGSLAVSPSLSASRARGKYRTAALPVALSFGMSRSQGHVRRGSLLVPVSFLAVPSGGAAPAPKKTGSWWGLYNVLQERAEYAQYYRSQAPVACPNDGTPLKNGPPESPEVELYCPFDGWQYPGDYDPDIHSGM